MKTFENIQRFDSLVSGIEVENNGEYHFFRLGYNNEYIICLNSYGTPKFWIPKDDIFSLDEHLQMLERIIKEYLRKDKQLIGRISLDLF